ncbi:MAG: hypothetical protein M3Z10_07675, partial [Gemmatimonadota bacterium]|nr:hypothetical protein [Gemmatimonadota bacterium]
MHHQWKDADWVSAETREALARALRMRRRRSRRGHTPVGLARAFERLCTEATAASQPPEAVLEVFRAAWDAPGSPRPDDDPRDLLY